MWVIVMDRVAETGAHLAHWTRKYSSKVRLQKYSSKVRHIFIYLIMDKIVEKRRKMKGKPKNERDLK